MNSQDNHETPSRFRTDLKDQARAFTEAADYLERRTGEGSGRAASFERQKALIKGWAQDREALIPEELLLALTLVSDSTSEHVVRFDTVRQRAVKVTLAGVYGQIPVVEGGFLSRQNATPAEYLRRMALQIEVFASDLLLEGATTSDKPSLVLFQPPGEPSFVVSQEWFSDLTSPDLDEIAHYMGIEQFVPVPNSYFGWWRPDDLVAVVDAKPDNFAKTTAGIVPLDLQMAVFSIEEATKAGLPLNVQEPQ
jgi:hypothetical protein